MVANNLYDLYLQQVVQLARTIVIKSEAAANAINLAVTQRNGAFAVNSVDPASWKYYKNISGEYHFTDTPMTVISMDTLETIDFTKNNLRVHRATAKAYQYGTREYEELVSRYPDQELLIMGVLYPADIDKAVSAPDHSILSYPTHLVESHEYSFNENLQKWINGFFDRWVNRQYELSDDLYPAGTLAIFYLQLVTAILNIRLRACKTAEAHTYHVRQYLLSHGIKAEHIDALTTKQKMWFYRNINYVERYAGQADTFDWLVEHTMTVRALPLAEYTMRHNVAAMPDEIHPELVFRRKEVNLGYSYNTRDRISLRELLYKQNPIAMDNPEVMQYEEETIQRNMEYSRSNVLMTKSLESAMVDYSDNVPYPLSGILINNWLWLSSNNYYTAAVSFTNQKTGERIPLTAKDAFCLYMYAFCKSFDLELVEVPPFAAIRVPRIPTPGIEDMLAVIDRTLVRRETAQAALDIHPIVQPVISIAAFYDLCKQIHTAANAQRRMSSLYEDLDARAHCQNMVSVLYSDNVCRVAEEGELYHEWLAVRNIDLTGFLRSDYELLATDILREATGLSLNTTQSIRDLQAAMIGLMTNLSSYSIQFITEINSSNIVTGENALIRLGNIRGWLHDRIDFNNWPTEFDNGRGWAHGYSTLDMNEYRIMGHGGSGFHTRTELDLPALIREENVHKRFYAFVDTGRMRFTPPAPITVSDSELVPVPGINEWSNSPENLKGFKDVYGNKAPSI